MIKKPKKPRILLQPDWGYRQSNRNEDAYADGWQRTYKGYPEMSPAVKDLLKEYFKKAAHEKIILFFVGHCGFDNDYSQFLLREMKRGNLLKE